MSSTIVHINTGSIWQIFSRDFRGEAIASDKATFLNVLTRVELEDQSRKMGFHVVVRVPKSRLKNEKEADAVALTWLYHHLPNLLSDTSYWNFFEATWLNWTEGPSEPAVHESHRSFSWRIKLTAKLSNDFLAACIYVQEIQTNFDAARKVLCDAVSHNTAFGFGQTLSEARQHFRCIEAVIACSGDLGARQPSDIRYALRDYEELGRRKIENNHNYQATLRDLQRVVYGVTFPCTWAKRPVLP